MIYVTDIVWDTDGVSIDDLPEEVMIDPKEIIDDDDLERLDECIGRYDGEIADYLSDTYGYCVEAFCSQIK